MSAIEDDDDLEATRISAPQASTGWQVVLADGRALPVGSALRFGRDPVGEPSNPGVVLVPLLDPARSLSKTHAQVEVDGAALVVTDLHSTNGSKVVTADGVQTVLIPAQPHRVTQNAELRFGDYIVRAELLGAGA